MFYLVLVMQVQQSRGDDDDTAKAIDKTFCYGECLAPCVKKGGWVGKAVCATKCTLDCGFSAESAALHSTNNIPNPRDNLYFCNIGCASSLCTNFVTKQNPEPEKVDGCVDSCSQTCMAKHPLLPNEN
ncbi:hypothetical protein M0R45_031719 [Rubus argutus]|uniref:Thionin-like protein 2 n=1 Tax=Rubus argutus TaxID=59490 RepID=A0AAW1WHA3_RUBAR